MNLFKKADPQTVAVKGHELKCPVCNNKSFWIRHALLNTPIATFFDLDWTNRSATCFVCSDCTHIFWFLGKQ
jgi:C4-type Zn-finger protein